MHPCDVELVHLNACIQSDSRALLRPGPPAQRPVIVSGVAGEMPLARRFFYWRTVPEQVILVQQMSTRMVRVRGWC